jgi:DNA polymerase-3 subunit delta'
MSSEQFNSAWEGIESGWENGQLAHAYLLQGAPHGAALRFTEKLLNLIFDNHPQIQTRSHPDLIWLEPQSKSRRITIDEVRAMIQQLSQTSFSGGWKVGVILCADRMTDQAANAFLKTLEEPPPRTLLIMVTDEPQSLLATITSRCQRIVLNDEDDEVSNHWKEPLLNILRDFPPASAPVAGLAAARLAAILKELYKVFENEELENIPEDLSAKESKDLLAARSTARMIEARSDILRTMLLWQRDVLFEVLEQDESALHFPDEKEALSRQATLCTRADALGRIAAVEEMGRQLDRNLPAELVFSNYVAQLV